MATCRSPTDAAAAPLSREELRQGCLSLAQMDQHLHLAPGVWTQQCDAVLCDAFANEPPMWLDGHSAKSRPATTAEAVSFTADRRRSGTDSSDRSTGSGST